MIPHTFLHTLLPIVICVTGNDLGPRPIVSILMAPDEDARIVAALAHAWSHHPDRPFPTVIATEPGPIDLRQGLRILPNEISPDLTLPDLLLIPGSAHLVWDDLLLAFSRRCLLAGRAIWVVGDHFPEALAELPLDPGQQIPLVCLARLADALEHKVRGTVLWTRPW